MPASKLGVIFPWYGCSFQCAGKGDDYGGCPTTPKGAPRTPMPLYGNIGLYYLPNATKPAWVNKTTLTNVMNYKDATGTLSQLWWDDPKTYKAKYVRVLICSDML